MPEVSVIIPCYNQGQYIDEAVESVLAQSFDDYEIIIINDGSTDKYTSELLKNYSRPKTKIIHSSNHGLPAARNMAISEASGKFILPLDADDKIGKDYLIKASEILNKDRDIGILYCAAELFGDKNGKWNLPDYTIEKILIENMIFATAFFRKEDWQKVGGYNPNMKAGWEDWDFWLSIISLGRKVYKIPDVLFYYRIKKHSMTKNLTTSDHVKLHTQIFYNHKNLFIDNIESIFREMYNMKYSWSFRICRKFENLLRLFNKLFRI
jgi:glycosyltransferase involved in cell wall biosynthesis